MPGAGLTIFGRTAWVDPNQYFPKKGAWRLFFCLHGLIDTYTEESRLELGDLINMTPTTPKDASKLENAIER